MRKLKMIIPAMVLAGCMMSMTASAAEKVSFNSVGIEMPAIECPEDMEGFFVPEEIGAIDAGHHVYAMDFVYGTKPEKEIIETLQDPELSDEERMQTKAKMVSVFGAILATDRGIEAAEKSYADDFGGDPMIFEEAQEIGTADGYTFYSVRGMTGAFENTLDLEHAKEFYAVRDAVDASIKEASFSVPVDPDKKMIGEKLEFTTTQEDSAAPENASAYRVIVKDADGPVEGAMIQLCDDTTCNLQPTDAGGVATFEVTEEKEYDVHVLVAPEGYEEDTTVYHTTPTFGDLNIELVKK